MRLDTVTVCERSVVARVSVLSGEPMRTSSYAGLLDRAVEALPGLERHVCSNPEGADILEELADTEIAHLYEHVVLELMALAGAPRTLDGATRWDFVKYGRGVFHVELACEDDLLCVGALAAGCRIVGQLMRGEPVGGLDATVDALRDGGRDPAAGQRPDGASPCRPGSRGAKLPQASGDER